MSSPRPIASSLARRAGRRIGWPFAGGMCGEAHETDRAACHAGGAPFHAVADSRERKGLASDRVCLQAKSLYRMPLPSDSARTAALIRPTNFQARPSVSAWLRAASRCVVPAAPDDATGARRDLPSRRRFSEMQAVSPRRDAEGGAGAAHRQRDARTRPARRRAVRPGAQARHPAYAVALRPADAERFDTGRAVADPARQVRPHGAQRVAVRGFRGAVERPADGHGPCLGAAGLTWRAGVQRQVRPARHHRDQAGSAPRPGSGTRSIGLYREKALFRFGACILGALVDWGPWTQEGREDKEAATRFALHAYRSFDVF